LIEGSDVILEISPNKMTEKMGHSWYWVGGVGFTFAFAVAGINLAKVPWVGILGPMLISIFLAVIYRQVVGYPKKVRVGIDFTTKKILRLAIILYGFNLNVEVVLSEGLGMLGKGVIVIAMAILITMLMAKWLKADSSLSLLLAVGTGVCGAAAIAAVAPIVGAKDEETAMGVGIIALMGTLFAAVYTIMFAFMDLDIAAYGSWVGLSLHEIAHVVAASAPAGEDGLAIALLAKLGRVFLLIPLCFLLTYWFNRKSAKAESEEGVQAKTHFPWFLLGFIITSLIGTYYDVSDTLLNIMTKASTFLLTAAMVGLGLNVSLQAIRSKALKPTLAMFTASCFIAILFFVF
jgi:uncharacterized integral membrane protein (TIGR00698 family)